MSLHDLKQSFNGYWIPMPKVLDGNQGKGQDSGAS
jgi:hypothetical protein